MMLRKNDKILRQKAGWREWMIEKRCWKTGMP